MDESRRHSTPSYRTDDRADGGAGWTRRGLLGTLGAGVALAGCVARGRSGGGEEPIQRAFTVPAEQGHERVGVDVPVGRYRRARNATHSFAAAMAAARGWDMLDRLAARIRRLAASRGAGLRAVQALTAGIDYATDRESTGRLEYVRFPAETLVDGEGDCDDKAVLLAGLLAADAFDCRTALLMPEGHCATLVARADLPAELLAPDPLTVALGGTEFVYVEAVEAVSPGRTAREYGTRPRLAAFTDRWHVLDARAVAAAASDELGRRLGNALPVDRGG
jgi:hypothetical protein